MSPAIIPEKAIILHTLEDAGIIALYSTSYAYVTFLCPHYGEKNRKGIVLVAKPIAIRTPCN